MKNLIIFISCISFCIFLSSCNGCTSNKQDTAYIDDLYIDYTSSDTDETCDDSQEVPYIESTSGLMKIPIKINDIPFSVILDTGASTTTITLAEARYLFEKGKLSKYDIGDEARFSTANGQLGTGRLINLKKVVIGENIVVHNVEAMIIEGGSETPLLLGKSVIDKFRKVLVNREKGVICFIGPLE